MADKIIGSLERHGWAIVNRYGNVWSDRLYDSPAEAVKFVQDFSGTFPNPKEFAEGFGIVRAKLAITVSPMSMTWPAPFTLDEASKMTTPHREYHSLPPGTLPTDGEA